MLRTDLLARRVCALAGAVASVAALAQAPTEFTHRAEVRPPAGTSIARVALPSATLSSLRGPDAGDLRVFNAAGQLLPYAVINAAYEQRSRPERAGVRIPALPIYAESSTSASTPTLRIQEGPNRRVIEYSAPGKAEAGPGRVARGLLFDTRSIDTEVRALDLEGALPTAMIHKISVDASGDLRSWQRLASDVPVFDFADTPGGSGPSNRRITLPGRQKLKDQYLRLTWTSSGAVPVTAVRTVGVGELPPVAPLVVDLGAPSAVSDEAVEWTLPPGVRGFDRYGASSTTGGTGALALRLSTSAANTLMPVRISTRARAGEPWRAVASTVVYRLEGTNPAVGVVAPLDSQVRVEPQRGYKLTGVPLTLSVEYPPLQVLFVATGDGPFTIASGKAGLTTAALPLTTLMPGYTAGAEFALPVLSADVVAGAANAAAGQASAKTSVSDYVGKSTILWAVLVLAVLVLAGLALALLRNPKK